MTHIVAHNLFSPALYNYTHLDYWQAAYPTPSPGDGSTYSSYPRATRSGRNTPLAMICANEVEELSARYGAPLRQTFNVQADDYIHSHRWRKEIDRRAEVVFAIQDSSGLVWVHTKAHYPAHIYRLPSGGIHVDERVEDALLREVREETNLPVRIQRFLGLIEYRFHYGESTVRFASYIFHLYSTGGKPVANHNEPISEFRCVLPSQILQMAIDLRNLIGNRRAWGQWRALAHDLVYENLTT